MCAYGYLYPQSSLCVCVCVVQKYWNVSHPLVFVWYKAVCLDELHRFVCVCMYVICVCECMCVCVCVRVCVRVCVIGGIPPLRAPFARLSARGLFLFRGRARVIGGGFFPPINSRGRPTMLPVLCAPYVKWLHISTWIPSNPVTQLSESLFRSLPRKPFKLQRPGLAFWKQYSSSPTVRFCLEA